MSYKILTASDLSIETAANKLMIEVDALCAEGWVTVGAAAIATQNQAYTADDVKWDRSINIIVQTLIKPAT